MVSPWTRYTILSALLMVLSMNSSVQAQSEFDQKHLEVSLRMIGHRVLLNAADSVSRVLPIIRENGQYRIEFESEFGFQPDDLVKAVSDIMKENQAAVRYIVEVEECESELVVYSFEIDNDSQKDIIPCKPRGQAAECFSLVFTILEKSPSLALQQSEGQASGNSSHEMIPLAVGAFLVCGIGMFVFFRQKRKVSSVDLIKLGKFKFDQRNALLLLEEQRTELTGKEADLLQLLYAFVNTPVKRETILSEIWEDEGNYVGRTLDVFISKLRAKLQADPSVKITNIRGVGYKLVVND